MRYSHELGVMGNIQRILTELKEQKNNALIADSKISEGAEKTEKAEAQAFFTALMTDTLLEGNEDE